jgi:hypothetical protein
MRTAASLNHARVAASLNHARPWYAHWTAAISTVAAIARASTAAPGHRSLSASSLTTMSVVTANPASNGVTMSPIALNHTEPGFAESSAAGRWGVSSLMPLLLFDRLHAGDHVTRRTPGHVQSARAVCVPNSPLVPDSPLVSEVQAQVLKPARALTRASQGRLIQAMRTGIIPQRVTPTADTNEPGQARTRTDALSAPSQAMDGVGQLGRALQARDQARLDRVDDLSPLGLVFLLSQQASI